MPNVKYRRILLKLSGEALAGPSSNGIEADALLHTARQIKALASSGVEVAIVVGGGNIFRGIQGGEKLGLTRVPADQMGMIGTQINGLALKEALRSLGCEAIVFSAISNPFTEHYSWEHAMSALCSKKVVIFVGGTGHPYFTTDTNAAQRANEIQAELLIKATMQVDGIYDKDPRQHPDAKKFDAITYKELVDQELGIIDLTAATLCMTGRIPIRVFKFFDCDLLEVVEKGSFGTLVIGDNE